MEPRLEIRHLRLLAAIADSGSVTQAAKNLHLTQSALSHQLRDAEGRLETTLFLRAGKRMVLTRAGERLLTCGRRILEQLGEAERQVSNGRKSARGVLRLTTECYTCYHWLPSILKKFHMQFPLVEVNIVAEELPGVDVALLDGKLDVAISACTRHDRRLRMTPMFEDELVLIMSPQHRLASMEKIQPEDLCGETVLVYPPREESILAEEVMRPAGVIPKRVIEMPLTEGIVELASAGAGIAVLARWAVAPYVSAGKIAARSLGCAGLNRKWVALTLRSQSQPKYLDGFVDLLRTAGPFQQIQCGVTR